MHTSKLTLTLTSVTLLAFTLVGMVKADPLAHLTQATQATQTTQTTQTIESTQQH